MPAKLYFSYKKTDNGLHSDLIPVNLAEITDRTRSTYFIISYLGPSQRPDNSERYSLTHNGWGTNNGQWHRNSMRLCEPVRRRAPGGGGSGGGGG